MFLFSSVHGSVQEQTYSSDGFCPTVSSSASNALAGSRLVASARQSRAALMRLGMDLAFMEWPPLEKLDNYILSVLL